MPSGPLSPTPLPVGSSISTGDPKGEGVSPALPLGKNILVSPASPPEIIWQALPHSLLYLQLVGVSVQAPSRKGVAKPHGQPNSGFARGQPWALPPTPALLALRLAGGLVEGVPQDGVLLLQASQLRVGAILQLLLQGPDLEEPNRG